MSTIGIGIEKIEIGTVGDGVPGTVLSRLTPISKDTVVFNFADASETKIEAEDLDQPVVILSTKDTDSLEFALISPDTDVLVKLMGGTASDEDADTVNDKWTAPTTIPDIYQTVKITTKTHEGKKVVYTVVNGKVAAKFSQAPGKEKEERVLVKISIAAAIAEDGTVNTPFIREVVTE